MLRTLTIVSAAAALLAACAPKHTAHPHQPQALAPYAPVAGGRYQPAVFDPRLGPQPVGARLRGPQSPPQYANLIDRFKGRRHIAHQVPAPPGLFQSWIDFEPAYTLFPGDQLDIVVGSAPELSRTLTVGPDGRIVMPMVEPIMVAGRTFEQVRAAIQQQLALQLRDPTVAISPRAYAPEQVFVGGEVGQPGTYTLPGPVGVLETVFMAGGFRPTARTREVVVLRRAPNGGTMMRVVDIKNGILNVRENRDNLQLRRGDIVFVPRTDIAEVGRWVQQFRDTLPVDFNISYQFGDFGDGVTTFVSP